MVDIRFLGEGIASDITTPARGGNLIVRETAEKKLFSEIYGVFLESRKEIKVMITHGLKPKKKSVLNDTFDTMKK